MKHLFVIFACFAIAIYPLSGTSAAEQTSANASMLSWVGEQPFLVIESSIDSTELFDAVFGEGSVEVPYPVRLETLKSSFGNSGRGRYFVNRGGLGLETGLRCIQYLIGLPSQNAKVTITYDGGSNVLSLRQAPDAQPLVQAGKSNVLAAPVGAIRAGFPSNESFQQNFKWLICGYGANSTANTPLIVDEWQLHIVDMGSGEHLYVFVPYSMTPHTNVTINVEFEQPD